MCLDIPIGLTEINDIILEIKAKEKLEKKIKQQKKKNKRIRNKN